MSLSSVWSTSSGKERKDGVGVSRLGGDPFCVGGKEDRRLSRTSSSSSTEVGLKDSYSSHHTYLHPNFESYRLRRFGVRLYRGTDGIRWFHGNFPVRRKVKSWSVNFPFIQIVTF